MKEQLKDKLSAVKNGEAGKAQFVRFIINGCFSAGVHYGIYLLMLYCLVISHRDSIGSDDAELRTNISYSIGYIISFVVNFYTTCYFTFRKRPSWKLFAGFSGSHGVNYGLHVVLFWLCLRIGINDLIAPFVVMGIAMLVQFTILKVVFRKK